MLVKACLNGARKRGEHASLPLTPRELAIDAERAVIAGAGALHVHPRDEDAAETLAAGHVHAAVAAIRAAAPGIPVGVSTGAWIEPDVEARVAAVGAWAGPDAPDFASVNLAEQGASEVRRALIDIGVGIEAGLGSPEDADLIEPDALVRVLLEPTDADGDAAWAVAREMADRVRVDAPLLAHGQDVATWTVLEHAIAAGWDVRIGLEDTLVLSDGRLAAGNAELVERVAVVTG